MEKKNNFFDVWIFIVAIFTASVGIGWLWYKGLNLPLSAISMVTGMLGFFFWIFIYRRPMSEMYYKGYPYRKLKVWGALVAFLFFEFIISWGLHTGQIGFADQNLYSVIVVFAGSLVFYFAFIRMRISLRYLFLGIFIPLLASGSIIGMGKYFGFVNFYLPQENVTKAVIFNTCYWIIFNMLYHLICEEPAFRGFLLQRLMDKGKARAVIISSLVFAAWRLSIGVFQNVTVQQYAVSFLESFTIGCLLAVLFIKGKNLLIAAITHGIIDGLRISLFAGDKYPGLDQYFTVAPAAQFAELKLIALWIGCLFLGIMLVLMIPQKRSLKPCRTC
ncbi:MAG: CPBP family intramembrane metalloprotease [Candidatus Omnitrophica bacterium]|nr:CPBP family intramembrane metalloprotease [Candidatus Omnitrophota bacterium]